MSQLQSVYPCLQITCASVGALSCVDSTPVCTGTAPVVTTIDRHCDMLRGEEIFGIVFGVLVICLLAGCVAWKCTKSKVVRNDKQKDNISLGGSDAVGNV